MTATLTSPPTGSVVPGSVTFSGFARHQSAFSGLPSHERSRLAALAARIVASERAGRPVRIVQVIGHADRDPRGPAYEGRISERRASAVRTALEQRLLHAGIRTRISWSSQGAGATRLAVRHPRSEADRRRNRRVEVNMVTPRLRQVRRVAHSGSAAAEAAPPAGGPIPPLNSRPCCLLAPTVVPFLSDSNLVDAGSLGTHNGGSEKVGLVYTGALGFLDLGHVRDMCDQTHVIYRHIAAAGGKPTTITTLQGEARVTSAIPSSLWLLVAEAIANDDGLAHEIVSYDQPFPGGHNSSFSPEDLCSNLIGTRIGAAALVSSLPFDAAVTRALASDVAAAGGLPKAGTMRAFMAISQCWVDFTGFRSTLAPRYLWRRNFSVWPWKVPGMPNSPTPSFVGKSFAAASPYYQYRAISRRGLVSIPKASFPAEISRIRADARARYGAKFDSDSCP